MDVWKKLWKKFTLITSTTPSVEPNSEVEHVASTLLALCQDKASDVADVHLASYVLTAEVLVLLTDTFQYVKLGKAAEQCECCCCCFYYYYHEVCVCFVCFLYIY